MGNDGEAPTQIDAVAEKAGWSLANVRNTYIRVPRGVACRKGHLHSTD